MVYRAMMIYVKLSFPITGQKESSMMVKLDFFFLKQNLVWFTYYLKPNYVATFAICVLLATVVVIWILFKSLVIWLFYVIFLSHYYKHHHHRHLSYFFLDNIHMLLILLILKHTNFLFHQRSAFSQYFHLSYKFVCNEL